MPPSCDGATGLDLTHNVPGTVPDDDSLVDEMRRRTLRLAPPRVAAQQPADADVLSPHEDYE